MVNFIELRLTAQVEKTLPMRRVQNANSYDRIGTDGHEYGEKTLAGRAQCHRL